MKVSRAITSLFSRRANRSVADYLAVLCGAGMARLLALASNILIARFLGSEKYGQFSLFYIFMLFAWIIPQAFDTTFVRFAKGHASSDRLCNYWRASVQMKVLYCTLIILSAWPIASILATAFFHNSELIWLLRIALICGSLLSLMNSVASSMQVQEKFGRFAILQGIYAFLVCLGLLILFLVTPIRSVEAVITLYVSVSVFTAVISFIVLLRATPDFLRFELAILLEMVGFGKWIFFTALAFYTFPRIDGIVLARYLDLHALGFYSVATQITMIISVVTGSMSAVFLPRAMQALDSTEALKGYILDSSRPVIVVIVGILILEFTAHFLVKTVYGQQYLSAIWPLRILLIGYMFSSIYLPLSFLYYCLNLPHIRFFLEASKLVLALVLFIEFIPVWGLQGAAMSMTLSLAINSLVGGGLLCFILQKRGIILFLK